MKHIPRIHIEQKLSSKECITLDKAASHHLITVLRLKQSSPVILFNGEGGEYRGTVTQADKRHAQVYIDDFNDIQNESPVQIELLQGIARQDRMDMVMQKAVELGVHSITPIWTDYSTVKMDLDKMEKRLAHWQKIIIHATEQSERCVLTQLNPAQKLSEKLNHLAHFDEKLMCHITTEKKANPLHGLATATPNAKRKVCLLIGPEGGLSENEVSTAQKQGFKIFTLGPRILRTETAAITALSIIQFCLGDL